MKSRALQTVTHLSHCEVSPVDMIRHGVVMRNIAARRSLLFFTIKVGCAKVDAYPGEHNFAVDLVLKR